MLFSTSCRTVEKAETGDDAPDTAAASPSPSEHVASLVSCVKVSVGWLLLVVLVKLEEGVAAVVEAVVEEVGETAVSMFAFGSPTACTPLVVGVSWLGPRG